MSDLNGSTDLSVRIALVRGARFGARVAVGLAGVCVGLVVLAVICVLPFEGTELATTIGVARSVGKLLGNLGVAALYGAAIGGGITGVCAAFDRRR